MKESEPIKLPADYHLPQRFLFSCRQRREILRAAWQRVRRGEPRARKARALRDPAQALDSLQTQGAGMSLLPQLPGTAGTLLLEHPSVLWDQLTRRAISDGRAVWRGRPGRQGEPATRARLQPKGLSPAAVSAPPNPSPGLGQISPMTLPAGGRGRARGFSKRAPAVRSGRQRSPLAPSPKPSRCLIALGGPGGRSKRESEAAAPR